MPIQLVALRAEVKGRQRVVEQIERELMAEPELDRILQKISRGGMKSLTADEHRFLQNASRRYQNQDAHQH